MVLGTQQRCVEFLAENHVVSIGGENITFVNQCKYLGVILDNRLCFSLHVNFLCKKIGKKVGFFYRISKNLSYWTKLLVFNTIISPHFTYCISLLIASNNTEVRRLQLLQNKCMRTILNCHRLTPTVSMLNALGWLNVDQLIKKANLSLIFKIQNNLLPEYLKSFLVQRSALCPYPLRSAEDFNIEFTRYSFLKRSLFSDGLRLYNSLPGEYKRCVNHKVFMTKIANMYRLENV